MFWEKYTYSQIKSKVFDSLSKNTNYRTENILGIPGTFLDTEIFYDDAIHQERKRSVDVLVLSKYTPSSVHTFGLRGVLGYTNALIAIKYPNLLVFNLHNQAGSKSSPGQQDKWLHYSRCRYDILESIRDLIDSNFSDMKNEQIIICGDFNFNLDGTI